jgi:hypothetical protein
VRVLCLASILAVAAVARAQDGPTIALGGDVLYDSPLAYQLRARGREVGRSEAYREVLSDLRPAIDSADLAIVNLEVPISPRYRGRDPIPDAPPVFRAPEDFLGALRELGVDAITVANNHAYDQGVRGLSNTLRAASAHELVAIGAGDDPEDAAQPVIVHAGTARIAIAAWTEGTNHRPGHEEGASPCISIFRAGGTASLARASDAHFVIASFHWTQEEVVYPTQFMRAAAREAAEAGADLVFGHGTHLPGRTETIVTSDGRRVPVLYSLGNLLAAMEEPAGTLTSREIGVRDAPLAIVRTRWNGGRLEVRDIAMRHHFIARPTEAPAEERGLFRPVSLETAITDLASMQCAECPRMLSAYRRRELLFRDAMRAIDEPPVERPRREPIERPEIARAVERSEPPALQRPRFGPRIPDTDPRLAPLLRAVPLTITFRADSTIEASVDAATIARIATLMREDMSLRTEVIVYASGSDRTWAEARARRVKGLIAVRGPSRSRFVARGADGPARVTVRLFR